MVYFCTTKGILTLWVRTNPFWVISHNKYYSQESNSRPFDIFQKITKSYIIRPMIYWYCRSMIFVIC
ncbi:hypothetical protein Lalb_Chr18g0051141 [Lupinus albus]|uniref:Uncharacterized protein n=1 Tax=Lupinus albus TaxID=3870 RepID=A0A6A4P6A9_LUPAL|nr:hypothetical protein Lalb_Chr18g0051141 [Lupinus albus]